MSDRGSESESPADETLPNERTDQSPGVPEPPDPTSQDRTTDDTRSVDAPRAKPTNHPPDGNAGIPEPPPRGETAGPQEAGDHKAKENRRRADESLDAGGRGSESESPADETLPNERTDQSPGVPEPPDPTSQDRTTDDTRSVDAPRAKPTNRPPDDDAGIPEPPPRGETAGPQEAIDHQAEDGDIQQVASSRLEFDDLEPSDADRLASGLVDAAGNAGIPQSELNIALAGSPSGEPIVRIYSDQAFLQSVRQRNPEVPGLDKGQPFSVDGPAPEPLALEAIPGLRDWVETHWKPSTGSERVRFEVLPSKDATARGRTPFGEVWLQRQERAEEPGTPEPTDEPSHGYPDAGPGTAAPGEEGWGITEVPRTLPDDHPLLTPTELINTLERAAFRDQLVAEVLGDARPPETGRPTLYVIGGGGASGKGFVLEVLQLREEVPTRDVVHLDPDGLKLKIPEYTQIKDAGDSRAAAVVHEESSALGKRILSEAMDRQVNIVYDVTLGNPRKAMDLIESARQAGYDVELIGVTVEVETAVARNASRAAETGRYVPVDMQLQAHQGFSRGFPAYVDLVDRAMLFDNNGSEPVLIASKAPGGELQVLDAEAYAAFRGNAELNLQARGPGELHQPSAVPAQRPAAALKGEAYVEKGMANLAATSRTAAGTIDVSASAGKAAQLADVSGDRAARLAQDNFRAVLQHLYDGRDAQFSSPAELRTFVEDVVTRVNEGITREGVLYREHDSAKYPSYTAVRDLPAVADNFFSEFHTRLADPAADPVETAAWVEYRMDLTDHLWADGVGKSSKAIAGWVLMRSGHELPTYPADRAAQFAHAPRLPRSVGPGVDAVQFREWLEYYRTLFGGTGG